MIGVWTRHRICTHFGSPAISVQRRCRAFRPWSHSLREATHCSWVFWIGLPCTAFWRRSRSSVLTWSNFAACFRGSVKGRDMNVFIFGATGYIGRAVTARLLNAGHRVTALVRSEASASRLPPGDVRVVAGSVEVVQALEKGLETADTAIYLAIQGTQGASDADRAALNAIVNHFRGTPRPLLVTSGLSVYVGTPEPFVDERRRSTRRHRRRPGV